ncbi:spermidine hydroxycinnamoyl transferase-like protein [Cinnamomum micranthum f. kanehirae]|uniref:Spermidine hydroxycinnamoyl transferase-like protein n=1 Tax=Cinnamomum micranthum f. kanehirae TaxID=337451 RepID=A0A3S3NFJ6_9MAGN|nr:spermidine hydroxycinnamoyl transferase-like protein [Cinnamomum micranthum f. kanehirae]
MIFPLCFSHFLDIDIAGTQLSTSFSFVNCCNVVYLQLGRGDKVIVRALSVSGNFGWGPPVYMAPAALGFEGRGFILPTKEEDGGMIVALRLQRKHMENLKELLSNHAL